MDGFSNIGISFVQWEKKHIFRGISPCQREDMRNHHLDATSVHRATTKPPSPSHSELREEAIPTSGLSLANFGGLKIWDIKNSTSKNHGKLT